MLRVHWKESVIISSRNILEEGYFWVACRNVVLGNVACFSEEVLKKELEFIVFRSIQSKFGQSRFTL